MEDFKTCAHCGREFAPNKFWQIYCSRVCTNAAYYIRKAKPMGVDDLDSVIEQDPSGPTEAQLTDRKRRIEGREAYEAEVEKARTREVIKKMEELQRLSNMGPSPLEALGYGSDRPAYPKIAKEREDEKAKQNQHDTDMAGKADQAGGSPTPEGDDKKPTPEAD